MIRNHPAHLTKFPQIYNAPKDAKGIFKSRRPWHLGGENL